MHDGNLAYGGLGLAYLLGSVGVGIENLDDSLMQRRQGLKGRALQRWLQHLEHRRNGSPVSEQPANHLTFRWSRGKTLDAQAACPARAEHNLCKAGER